MNQSKHFPPVFHDTKFHCPHCQVFAQQHWHTASIAAIYAVCEVSNCDHCNKYIFWLDEKIIYPQKIVVAPPNPDLNEDIIKDYNEAATVFPYSARASAALLRLALQKLCKQLGEKGKNINDDIKSMVAKGLNPTIQQALDSLRIIGNNAVHPGEINLEEEPEKVLKLFELLNVIANQMITAPKEIERLFGSFPEKDKEAIKKRDGNI
jgi:hypothetical protein